LKTSSATEAAIKDGVEHRFDIGGVSEFTWPDMCSIEDK
jgi:hypothetical protein